MSSGTSPPPHIMKNGLRFKHRVLFMSQVFESEFDVSGAPQTFTCAFAAPLPAGGGETEEEKWKKMGHRKTSHAGGESQSFNLRKYPEKPNFERAPWLGTHTGVSHHD